MSFRLVVSGRVQGVAFRACMRDIALENRVRGWVRNRDDGVVLSVLQGDEADVERVIEWAKRGPPSAKVTAVHRVRLETYPQQIGFRIFD